MKTTPPLRLPSAGMLTTCAVFFLIFLFGPPYVVFAATPPLAELMEQGIYAEETKGDLDAAMQLYQQILKDADAAQSIAVQAQLRLAMCYDKKKDYPAATAAFEKLIKIFPEQTAYVKLANEYLADGAAVSPAPWTSGEDLRYQIKTPSGAKMGLGRNTVEAGEINGQKIWRFSSHLHVGMQQWSQSAVAVGTLKPIHNRWKHPLVGEAEISYVNGGADVTFKGKEGVTHADFDGIVYDNEEAVHLFRCLPLAAGYNTTVAIFVGLTGATLPIKLEVTGPEVVQVPAGNIECFKVALNIGQTLWYSADAHRYLVKFEGGGIVSELTAIHQHVRGEATSLRDALFGFSFKTMADGFAARMETEQEKRWSTYLFLDPQAKATMQLKVEPLDRFDSKNTESLRAFAEYKMGQGRKAVQKFEVRADSWRTLMIDGQPALGYVADMLQNDKSQVFSVVYGFVDGKAVEIWFATPPDDFKTFLPKFEMVVDSYRAK